MDAQNKLYSILLLFVLTLLINLPFGVGRARSKRYSFRWFLFIHLPIPLIFFMRMLSHVEMKYIPVLAVAALLGQVIGGRVEIS